MVKIDGKSCFIVKKLISTSEQRAEHPLAGRNTQQFFISTSGIPSVNRIDLQDLTLGGPGGPTVTRPVLAVLSLNNRLFMNGPKVEII